MRGRKVKITVIKRLDPKDVVDKETRELSPDLNTKCSRFKEGDEFIMKDISTIPQGFPCAWAFNDIYKNIIHLSLGGTFPWVENEKSVISCCTDGLRPVIFKIEALES